LWARQDLNLGPTDYESAALTAELQARTCNYKPKRNLLHHRDTQFWSFNYWVQIGSSILGRNPRSI
jgi:hypothetical protein